MAITAGMTSAIMNPVQAGVSDKKLDERLEVLRALGVEVPESIDRAALSSLLGLGAHQATASKEMEAIRAANFLMNNDPHGSQWIKFNKPATEGAAVEGARGRREGRRRRAIA